jgi:hypothetical protein
MGNRFYHDDPSMTKSYINVLFHASALPNGERMDVVPAAVLRLLKALSTLFDETSRSYLGHLDTTESHMRHMRSTDGASISKTTKVALNTAMHLPKNLCMIEPPRACMAISNDNDEGTYECWRREVRRIEPNDAGDG